MNQQSVDTLIDGISRTLPDAVKEKLEQSVQSVAADLDAARVNRQTGKLLDRNTKDYSKYNASNGSGDTEMFSTISEMINGNTKDFAGFGTTLDSLYAKNKRYYTIIKDYEIMPILIPQVNRVLMFLVNECISPDVQNDETFLIKYIGSDNTSGIDRDIAAIKKEMKLDNILRDVYMNRYKLGNEYYLVVDYNTTFNHMLEMIQRKKLNEDTAGMSDMTYLDSLYGTLATKLDECSCELRVQKIADPTTNKGYTGTRAEKEAYVTESVEKLTFKDLNIVIERSPVARLIEDAQAELLHEAYSGLSSRALLSRMVATGSLNEAVVDTSKLEQLVDNMKRKKIQRCTIERLDPAKMFKLKIGGKVIGYFYITDINETTSNMVNFAQSLKDQLLKTRATNLSTATQSAEEVISKELAERVINTFDPNIGINRIEDIDLMHDFVRHNEIYKGNKRITFYYEDEIYDLSRADGSILTNGVFFTKLYATLLLNNIMTKVLRGRGRQIHTVRMGASPAVQRYIQNAMASLTMPENNLGTLHGSFEQILNPFNSASDIVIPTEENDERYITTDYIPGQDVDMNDDFLKTLLNAIVSSFGLDSAVIDATNGNIQFARTLSMESLQIANSVRNEQQDLHDSWERLCLEVIRIMGNEATQKAVNQGQIEVKFFEPRSLIVQNMIEDLNSAKNLAEAVADVIPQFNEDGAEQLRSKFVYHMVKERTNMDFTPYENEIRESELSVQDDQLNAKIREIIREYMDNTREETYGDVNGDGMRNEPDDHMSDEDDNADLDSNEDTYNEPLTDEEQELVDMPDEEPDEGESEEDIGEDEEI